MQQEMFPTCAPLENALIRQNAISLASSDPHILRLLSEMPTVFFLTPQWVRVDGHSPLEGSTNTRQRVNSALDRL